MNTNVVTTARELLVAKATRCQEPGLVGALAQLTFDLERGDLSSVTDDNALDALRRELDNADADRITVEAVAVARPKVTLGDPAAALRKRAQHDCAGEDWHDRHRAPESMDADAHMCATGAMAHQIRDLKLRTRAILALIDALTDEVA